MARPHRNNVDYFPHYISDGKKMFIIESKFGNDGYAVWFKILETLAKTDGHWIDLQDESNLMYLAAKCRVSDETLLCIIDSVVKLGELDSELWNQQRVIWCQKFVDSIEDAYRKRSNECMNKESLLCHLSGLGRKIKGLGSSKGGRKPQSKVEESKEEKTKHRLVSWIEENASRVQELQNPITDEQADRLKNEFHKDYIMEQFSAMHNFKALLKNYIDANKTFRSWANRDQHYKKWKDSRGIIEPNLNLK